jgi:hypothetical protein
LSLCMWPDSNVIIEETWFALHVMVWVVGQNFWHWKIALGWNIRTWFRYYWIWLFTIYFLMWMSLISSIFHQPSICLV